METRRFAKGRPTSDPRPPTPSGSSKPGGLLVSVMSAGGGPPPGGTGKDRRVSGSSSPTSAGWIGGPPGGLVSSRRGPAVRTIVVVVIPGRAGSHAGSPGAASRYAAESRRPLAGADGWAATVGGRSPPIIEALRRPAAPHRLPRRGYAYGRYVISGCYPPSPRSGTPSVRRSAFGHGRPLGRRLAPRSREKKLVPDYEADPRTVWSVSSWRKDAAEGSPPARRSRRNRSLPFGGAAGRLPGGPDELRCQAPRLRPSH